MNLLAACCFLLCTHLGISSSRLRDALVERLGERPYRLLFNLVTLFAFGWLIAAYRNTPIYTLWKAPAAMKLATLPAVLLGFIFVVAGLTTPNPTVVGGEKLFDRPDIVRGVLRVTRNPFLWGMGLWALAHAVSTGELASTLMFASITVLGFVGAWLLDAKKARQHPAGWGRLASVTSNVPFLAIVQGRQKLVMSEIGWWRIAAVLFLFAVALYGHRWAFGGSPVPEVWSARDAPLSTDAGRN